MIYTVLWEQIGRWQTFVSSFVESVGAYQINGEEALLYYSAIIDLCHLNGMWWGLCLYMDISFQNFPPLPLNFTSVFLQLTDLHATHSIWDETGSFASLLVSLISLFLYPLGMEMLRSYTF